MSDSVTSEGGGTVSSNDDGVKAVRSNRSHASGADANSIMRHVPVPGALDASPKVSSRWPMLLLARLKKLRLLGSGGFGDVYEAIDVMSGNRFAVKQFKRDMVQREEVRNEVRALTLLPSHPGLMHLGLCVTTQQQITLVTELVEGQSLHSILQERRLITERSLQIILAQLVSALRSLHAQGIVHRDIKPENIMITESSSGAHVKILDFGLSERIDMPYAFDEGAGPLFGISNRSVGSPRSISSAKSVHSKNFTVQRSNHDIVVSRSH